MRKTKERLNHQGHQVHQEKKRRRFGLKQRNQYLFLVFLGALVPIFHKTNYGNRYYTDLFKSFIEGRHGVLVVKEVGL
jgi:hypothetical protein